jgi:DNA repair protein RadA/Sms
VFVNVAGGAKITEPAADLAVAAAIASSWLDRPLPPDMVIVGEVGLAGEIRRVGRLKERLTEAARLGFKKAAAPAEEASQTDIKGLSVLGARNVQQFLHDILDFRPNQRRPETEHNRRFAPPYGDGFSSSSD